MDANTPDHLVEASPNPWVRMRAGLARVVSDRRKLRSTLMWGGGGLVIAICLFAWLFSGRYVGTEDAYVRAAKLLVTTDVSGIVTDVQVKEGQLVKAGDVLFRLDPAPFRIALDNAKARLDQAVLDIQSMKQDYQRMLTDIQGAEAQVALDGRNLGRDQALVKNGNVSRANFDQTRITLELNQRKLQSLQQQAAAQLLKLSGKGDIAPEDHPAYKTAKSAYDEAVRQLDHTIVRAPFSGIVTEVDSLQPGTLVISALSSFSTTSAVGLVSSENLWIEAQMKETDLTHVRAGNPVSVRVDAYPDCDIKGTVEAISPATGSAFSILPAQNASGNWVKVVQRIAVRIKLQEGRCLARLREGLSSVVDIDTGQRRWSRMLIGSNP